MRQALGQRVSIARVDRGAVMRYGRWALMRPPCSAALMRPLCVRPECPAFLYPGVGAAGYSSQTHGEEPGADAVDRRMTVGAGGVELLTANPLVFVSRRIPVAVGSRDRMSMTRLPAGLSRCGGSMWGSHVPGTSGRRPAGLTFASLLPCGRSIGSSSGELERVALQGHSSR